MAPDTALPQLRKDKATAVMEISKSGRFIRAASPEGHGFSRAEKRPL
jgi:hypothetical protein